MDLQEARSKLQNVAFTQTEERYGENYPLRTVVSDLNLDNANDVLSGTLSYETLQTFRSLDGRVTFVAVGRQVLFHFFQGAVTLYMSLFARRGVAENSAGKMNYILTRGDDVPNPDLILNYFISTQQIEAFLRNNPHIVKLCGWKNLDYPSVNRSSLHGSNVRQFSHAVDYDAHGDKSYIMIELPNENKVVRISDQGIVTFYTSISPNQITEWIKENIVT